MSRTRSGQIDPLVAELSHRVAGSAELHALIERAVLSCEGTSDHPEVYAAAVTQALGPGLKQLGLSWLRQAEQEYRLNRTELSPRTRVGRLLGISRQSVDAAFGHELAGRSTLRPVGEDAPRS